MESEPSASHVIQHRTCPKVRYNMKSDVPASTATANFWYRWIETRFPDQIGKTMKFEHVSESNPRKELSLSTPIPAWKRFFRWWWGWLVVSCGLWRFVFFPVSLLCPRLGGFGLVVFCPRAFRPTFLSLVGGLSGLAKRLVFAVFRRWNTHFEEMIQFEPVWFCTRNFQCFGFSIGGCESRFSHVSFLFMFPCWQISKFLSASQWSIPKQFRGYLSPAGLKFADVPNGVFGCNL